MKHLPGKVAAITGAGSGIGRGLALELANTGCHLAVSDVDDIGLAETVAMVERSAGTGGSVKIASAHVDMNINFWGVVHGTLAFLPHLKASGDGHVINISSVFGLLGIPSQSAYNSSKFAVRGFTDALRTELDIERCGVSATTIHPGGIRTNIARNARFEFAEHEEAVDAEQAAVDFDKFARTTPEKAARLIIGAVEKNKRRALIGPDAHLFDAAARLSPRASQWALGKLVARSGSAIA